MGGSLPRSLVRGLGGPYVKIFNNPKFHFILHLPTQEKGDLLPAPPESAYTAPRMDFLEEARRMVPTAHPSNQKELAKRLEAQAIAEGKVAKIRKSKQVQERADWVREFMVDFNPAQATMRLGLASDPREAKKLGGKFLRHPEVQVALQAQLQRKLEDQEVAPDRVLVELARIAFLDPLDVMDDDGQMKPLSQIPAHARRAICGVQVSMRDGDVRITPKLLSKVDALANLGKHLKLFGAEAAPKQDFSITFVNPPSPNNQFVEGQVVSPRLLPSPLPEPVKAIDREGARKIQEALDSVVEPEIAQGAESA